MQQPLNVLSAGLLRWLQSLPRYCRDTNEISPAAQKLRTLIRKAQREPSQVLSYELLELLDSSKSKQFDESACRQMFTENLSCLMDEISTAYQTLLYFLDHWVRETFSVNASDGHTALYIWLEALEKQNNGKSLGTFRFSDKLAEQLVEIARQDGSNQRGFFGDRLSKAVLGIALSDWNDQSKENFKQTLLKAKLRVEQEIFDLAADEAAVQLSVSLPDQDAQTYRFRQSGLSPQGQRILQNFKSTLEIAGRPLSLDEKRQIVLALMDYVMGGSNHND